MHPAFRLYTHSSALSKGTRHAIQAYFAQLFVTQQQVFIYQDTRLDGNQVFMMMAVLAYTRCVCPGKVGAYAGPAPHRPRKHTPCYAAKRLVGALRLQAFKNSWIHKLHACMRPSLLQCPVSLRDINSTWPHAQHDCWLLRTLPLHVICS